MAIEPRLARHTAPYTSYPRSASRCYAPAHRRPTRRRKTQPVAPCGRHRLEVADDALDADEAVRRRHRLAVEPQLQSGGVGCERDRGLAWQYVAAHRLREPARVRDLQVEPVEDVGRGLFQGRDGERTALRAALFGMRGCVWLVVVKVDPPRERAGGQDAVFEIVAGAGVVDHGSARVGGPGDRLRYRSGGRRILRDGQLRGVAGRRAEIEFDTTTSKSAPLSRELRVADRMARHHSPR